MSGNTPPQDKQPSRSGAELPSDCLSSIPMPKNWNQVEELKSMKHKLQQKIAAVSKHYERERITQKDSKSNVDEASNRHQIPSGCASGQAVVSKAKGCLQLACDSLETSRPHHKQHKHKKHKHKKHKNKDRSKSHHDLPKCGSSIPLIDTLDHKKHLISNLSETSDLQNIALMKPLVSKPNVLPATSSKCFPVKEKVSFESQDDTMEVLTAEKINQALSHAKICAKENEHKLHTSDKITNIVEKVIGNPLQTVKGINPKVVLKDLGSPNQILAKLTSSYKDEKLSMAQSSDRKKGPKYSRKSDEKCIEKEEENHLKSITNEISHTAMPVRKKVDVVNNSTVGLPLTESSDYQNKAAVSSSNDQLSYVTDEIRRRQLLNKTSQCLTKKFPTTVERKSSNNDKSVQQSKGSQTYKEIADMKALYLSKKLLLNKQKLILMKLELEMKKQGIHEEYALKRKLAQATKTGELELQNIKKSLVGSKSSESVSLSPPVTSTTDVKAVSGVKTSTVGSIISSDSNIKNSVCYQDTSNADNLKRNHISLNAKTDAVELKPTRVILEDKPRSTATDMQSKTIFQTANNQNCNTQTCSKPGYQISKLPIVKSAGMPVSSASRNNIVLDMNNGQTNKLSLYSNSKCVSATDLKYSSVSTLLSGTHSSAFVGHSVACPQNSTSSSQTFIVASSNTIARTQTIVFPPLFPRIPVVPRGIHIAGHNLGIEYTRANSYVNTYLSSAGNIKASQMMGNSVNNSQQFSIVTLPVEPLFGSSNFCSDSFRPAYQNVNGSLYPVLNILEPGCTDFHQNTLGSLSSDIRNAEVNTESEHSKSTICISAMTYSEKQQLPTVTAVQKDKKYRFHSGKPQQEQTVLSTAKTSESCCTTGTSALKPVASHTILLQTTEKQGNSVPVKLYGKQRGYLSGLLCSEADIQQMSVDKRTSILQNKCLSDAMPVEDESKLELFEQFKVKPSATSDNKYQYFVAETEKHPKEKVDSLPRIENYFSLSENTFEKLTARQNDKNGSGSEAGVNKSQTKILPQKHRVVNITLQSDNLKDQPCHMPLPTSNSSPKAHQILAENELLEYLRSTCNEKTKLILLKGDVCDKWERVKKNVCAEATSDPEFLHYLLNTVEEALHKSQSETDEQPTSDQTSETESRMAPQNETLDPAPAARGPSVIACPDFITVDSDDSDHLEIIDIDGGALPSPHSTEEKTDENNNTVAVLDHGNDVITEMKFSRKRPASELVEELTEYQTSVKRLAGQDSRPAVEVSDQSELAMGPAPAKPVIKSEGPAVIDESPSVESSKVRKSLSLSQEFSEGANPSSVLKPITTKTSSSEYLIQQYFREKMYTIPSRKDVMWYIDHFRGWLRDNGLEEDFEHKTAEWINALLHRFYVDVAKRYSKAGYCFLFLGRLRDHMFTYLRWLSSNKVNLKEDSEFKSSNQVYSIVSKVDSGFVPTSKATVAFTEEDEVKLRNSGVLSDKSPENLLWKVYFDIIYYLGEESFPKYFLHNLKKDSLVLSSDERGRFYTFKDEGWPPHWAKNRKMYESLGGSETCPVRTMKLYLGKLLGSCNALFQVPKARCCTIVGDWYKNSPVSQKKLNCIMSEISKAAQLSNIYSYASVALLAKKHKFLGQLKKIE